MRIRKELGEDAYEILKYFSLRPLSSVDSLYSGLIMDKERVDKSLTALVAGSYLTPASSNDTVDSFEVLLQDQQNAVKKAGPMTTQEKKKLKQRFQQQQTAVQETKKRKIVREVNFEEEEEEEVLTNEVPSMSTSKGSACYWINYGHFRLQEAIKKAAKMVASRINSSASELFSRICSIGLDQWLDISRLRSETIDIHFKVEGSTSEPLFDYLEFISKEEFGIIAKRGDREFMIRSDRILAFVNEEEKRRYIAEVYGQSGNSSHEYYIPAKLYPGLRVFIALQRQTSLEHVMLGREGTMREVYKLREVLENWDFEAVKRKIVRNLGDRKAIMYM